MDPSWIDHVEELEEVQDHVEELEEVQDHVEELEEAQDHVEELEEAQDHVEELEEVCGKRSLGFPSVTLDKAEGVIAQDTKNPTPERQSFIAASYVKFLEAAGARVVPIHINKSDDEHKALFKSINGVLFPGGSVSLSQSGYAKATRLFLALAKEANDQGDYFPVLGICLGFQLLACVVAEKRIITSSTPVNGVALPLNFTKEAKESRTFKGFPKDALDALATEPLMVNIHKYSVTLENYMKLENLNTFYRVLTTNTSDEGEVFISTMEAYNYPFYGVQWHPEKNQFEWTVSYIPHSPSAVEAARCVADFFVSEARKNLHSFDSEAEERKALIYQCTPSYTGDFSPLEQTYFFS